MSSPARQRMLDEADPMYAVAMLRIAMELKKPQAAHMEEIVEGVLKRMKLDRDDFRRYLNENVGLLMATAKAKGF
jgi:hypothetical protein